MIAYRDGTRHETLGVHLREIRRALRAGDALAALAEVDAADDGDGLRWPGPADRAWDVAGLAIEFDLPAAAMLVERCARAAGEAPSALAAAVRAYRPVYAACALGDAALSAREAFTPADRRRLEAEVARYAGLLARELSD